MDVKGYVGVMMGIAASGLGCSSGDDPRTCVDILYTTVEVTIPEGGEGVADGGRECGVDVQFTVEGRSHEADCQLVGPECRCRGYDLGHYVVEVSRDGATLATTEFDVPSTTGGDCNERPVPKQVTVSID